VLITAETCTSLCRGPFSALRCPSPSAAGLGLSCWPAGGRTAADLTAADLPRALGGRWIACARFVLAAALAGWPDDAEPAALVHCSVPMLGARLALRFARACGGRDWVEPCSWRGLIKVPMAGRQDGAQA